MLRFAPHYKSAVWGGRRLETAFGRELPDGPIGESWELVEHESHHSCTTEGLALGEAWRTGRLGGSASGNFPFLLKWLDTHAALSVQVHPDEKVAAKIEGASPKTEAWYFADVVPGSEIMIGHYPGLDRKLLEQTATKGTIAKWLHAMNPRVGDGMLVPAGTLHALGAGFLVLEVQQPSDTTYRVYDWGRMGTDGRPRALHLEQAAEATDFNRVDPPAFSRAPVVGPCFGFMRLGLETEVSAAQLRVIACVGPRASLNTERENIALVRGDVIVLERADGVAWLKDGVAVWLSEVSSF